MSEEIAANKRRVTVLVVGEVVVVSVVLGVPAALLLGWWALVVVVVLAVAAAVLASRQATLLAIRRSGGEPADPLRHARLHNLTEGLCGAAGVPKPALYVLADDGPNALACGRSPRTAAVVVTQGLLDQLSRIELEGVLAHELSHIKSFDILPATVAVVLAAPLGPRLVGWVVRPGREALADAQGVSITRYPPGLLAALEKIDVASVVMRPRSRTIAHLWLVPPETGPAQRPSLDERIEALKEL